MPQGLSKILVTGGAGFIGSHIVDRLLQEGFEVIMVDNLSFGQEENFVHNTGRNDFQFIEGDIRDTSLIKGLAEDIDAVFHDAAMISVVSSLEDPLTTHDVNVTGTLNLLKTCLDSDVKRFIFASSASVYGVTEILPMKEDMASRAASPYAVSKLAAEHYIELFYKVYGLETVSLRYFNVYGPRQRQSNYSGVISNFMNQLLCNKSPVIFGKGEQKRDFVNVQDIVDANMLALRKEIAVGQTLNIGTGKATSVNQLARIMLRISGKKNLQPIHTNPRLGETGQGSCADISKARRVLGFHPKISLETGIIQLIAWYKTHKQIARTN